MTEKQRLFCAKIAEVLEINPPSLSASQEDISFFISNNIYEYNTVCKYGREYDPREEINEMSFDIYDVILN
jgi:hypothetical protein